jgi:hypothetical protein
LRAAKALGVNVSPLVNFRLICRNSEVYRRLSEDLVQRGIYGTPMTEEWSHYRYNFANFGPVYLVRDGRALCLRSEAVRSRSLDIVRQTLDLGFTSLFIDQPFDSNPCFAGHHQHRSPDDTHEAVVEWCGQAGALVRARNAAAYTIGENTDVFGMAEIDLSFCWVQPAPEVIRYTLPEALQCWVVDRQPEILNRGFALGFLLALTTHELTQTLTEYPSLGRRVAQLARLKKRCAEFIVDGKFRDQTGLKIENAIAYVYDAPCGLAVIIADVDNKSRRVQLTLDPKKLGKGEIGPSTLHHQNGSRARAGHRLRDGRVRLETKLSPLEVAVWTIPCR